MSNRDTKPLKDVPLNGNNLPWDQYAKKMGFGSELEMYRFQDELGIPDYVISHVVGVGHKTVTNRNLRKKIRVEQARKAGSRRCSKGTSRGFSRITKVFSRKQTLRLIQFLAEEWKRSRRIDVAT